MNIKKEIGVNIFDKIQVFTLYRNFGFYQL